MPSLETTQRRRRAGTEDLPATQTPKRIRKAKRTFGRDENGPASSPIPSPTRLVTPEVRRSRRISAASYQNPNRDAPSEDELQWDASSSTACDDNQEDHRSTTPDPPAQNPFNMNLEPPALRSYKSAPASPTPIKDHDDKSPRPSQRQRSASDRGPQQYTAAQIDRDLAALILKGPTAQPAKQGYNYVLMAARSDNGPLFYKVGISVDTKKRVAAIKNKCKLATLMEKPSSTSPPLYMYKVAEKLMQQELKCFRYLEDCPCMTVHKEYFLVEEQWVDRAFKRWHAFCGAEPWDEDGQLRPRWKHRLENRPRLGNDCDHEGLVKAWEQVVSPTPLQEIAWDIRWIWSIMSLYWWQVVAFFEAMAIALIAAPSVWAWRWVLIVAICIFVERLQLGDTWTLNRLAGYIERIGIGEDAAVKKPTIDEDSTARTLDTPEEDVMMKLDDDTRPSENETDTRTSEKQLGDNDALPTLPGAWNYGEDDAATVGTVYLNDTDDTMDVEDEDDIYDADESNLTEDYVLPLMEGSRERPIILD